MKRKLTKEEAKLWVEALRSGNYDQGKGNLKRILGLRKYEYCCLGVLCEVVQFESHSTAYITTRDPIINDPLDKIYEFIPCDEQHTLASRNDRGESFSGIADYIERRYVLETKEVEEVEEAE